jgi:hypothetical protein
MIYVWQGTGGKWQRSEFTEGGPLQPPDELLPDYVKEIRRGQL